MPDITIEQATFERLQRHAQPLIDSVDGVVNRALDAMETGVSRQPDERVRMVEHEVDPDRLPDMRHTKVLAAKLAGEDIRRPNWNRLLHRVLVLSKGRVADLNDLPKLCPANMVPGSKTDEGYSHLPEIDISVQGLSANEACAALTVTARALGIELDVAFLWRAKEGAEHPGERGRLQVPAAQKGL